MINLKFLPPTAHGLPGKKILHGIHRLRLDDSKEESGSEESDSVDNDDDDHSSLDESEEDTPEDSDDGLDQSARTKTPKGVSGSKSQVRKMWSEPFPAPKNIEIVEHKPSSVESSQAPSKEHLTDVPQKPSDPTADLADVVTTRLSEWITIEAIQTLGSETEPSATELEKQPKPAKFEKVTAFLKGSDFSSLDPECDPASDYPVRCPLSF
ncbi:unnamed protein product [Dibothriocephalus latus]|uniref:Uncharacterized protein n=1 Tax=Dibothriocephalus latus TaxID=60516 RepID=A0A3P6PZ79_DIBLA|nr:unnamed protein product [Dibothriocephalus latus]